MSGNCAIGSCTIAMTPRITMMIEITIATIGRLMKNLAMAYSDGRARQRAARAHRVGALILPQLGSVAACLA